ncbi:hypothetical protein G6F37_004723 [Rhizopus arrhizus]|nr:hypothetical protein G6F38_002810 [Rhizopus arrhizus]KAG1159618.1 hypothetical protein G6F37_004723 [Rhizopus arrhizus]
MSFLIHLPNEILYEIISLLSPVDLSRARDVCLKIRSVCDQPCYWKSIVLDAEKDTKQTCSTALPLWSLKDLKDILEPHRLMIEKVHIRGVRDSIIQYLLLACPQLKDLTVCGWLTLSDHSVRIPLQTQTTPFTLHRLRLIGDSQQKSNFVSLDSTTLGQLISRCPDLQELSVNCQVHFQAEDLIHSLKSTTPLALRSLVIATKNTWSSRHVTQLFQHCTQLEFLGLIPDGASLGYLNEDKKSTRDFSASMLLRAIVLNQIEHRRTELVLLEKHSLPVEEEEMAAFQNIAVFK